MTIPPVETTPPPEITPSLPPSLRRRRRRRLFIPSAGSERTEFMEELADTLAPSLDFILFAMVSGMILCVAVLVDAPALYLLAALLAPFMAPLMALALAAVAGSPRFFFLNLAYFLVGSAVIFLAGTGVGLVSRLFPAADYLQTRLHSASSWTDFILLTFSASLSALLLVRNPRQKPLVASVGVAYELFLPLGVAGFGAATGREGLFPQALGVFGVYLLWSVLVFVLIYMLLGIRPLGCLGYIAEAGLLFIVLALVALMSGSRLTPSLPLDTRLSLSPTAVATQSILTLPPASPPNPTRATTPIPSQTVTPTSQPATITPSPTPTNTLVPSATASQTLAPQATPVWARVASPEGNGIVIRAEPRFDALITHSLFNGVLVMLMPDTVRADGATWVKIRTADGKEGWVVRSLLSTATPAP